MTHSLPFWQRLKLIFVVLVTAILSTTWLATVPPVHAQGDATAAFIKQPLVHTGTIVEKSQSEVSTYDDGTQTVVQTFLIDLDASDITEAKQVEVSFERLVGDNLAVYEVGDRVIVNEEQNPMVEDSYFIADYIRGPSLFWITALFVVLVLGIGRWHGVRSLIGLASSFGIIFYVILPYLQRGVHPILVAVGGSALIMLVTFYLSHGFNRKTTIAVAGTFFSLIATGVLSLIFISMAKLTGFATEEAAFLQITQGESFNAQGLLLAGIIIGTLGVLDDITLSQASVVQELIQTNPKLSNQALFRKAMNVGKDHIASLVNTLILVYTGGSLPLLLLFSNSNVSTQMLFNFEMIAEEVVRTLVGSIGLILAVPITTFLAVLQKDELLKNKSVGHSHSH